MTTQRTPEDAKYWLDEAEQRLNDARRYVPKENARIRCEQAHFAAEFAIKGVIIATGESFATTHDIIQLLDTARRAGETIPKDVRKATGLSTYAGAGRYEFDRKPELAWVGRDEYERAVNAAGVTVEWARGRIERLIDDGNTEKDGDRRTGRR